MNEIDKKKTWNSIQEFGIYVSNIIKSVIRKQKEEIVAKYTFKTLDKFIADSNGNAGTIPLELKEGVYAELTKFEFNCQALVIGFNVNSEGSIYSIDENGTLSKISDEFCSSIGTGEPFSQIYFDQHDYDVQCSLSQGLFFAYSAKKSAEFHTGVGKKTDIIVLQAGEPVKEITSESNEMSILEECYKTEQEEIKKVQDQIANKITQEVFNS